MSSMQHLGKGIVRAAKNYTKGYSDVQAKVRDATSNDPWGPSGTQMNDLAQMSYNQDHFVEIMEMLDKRLNDKGKNWRHVFKSLTVLDYLLHAGSENVVVYFRDNIYIIKTLKEFQYIDEEGKDQGANVRQKAKDITNLLQDESRLRRERRDRASMRDRMVRGRRDGEPGEDDDGTEGNENDRRRSRSVPGNGRRRGGPGAGGNREDDDLRRALEESKRTAAEEIQRQRLTAEERDLQQAIRLSEEEEAKRNQALADANASSLFDEGQQQQAAQQSTNPFPLVDTSLQAAQPQFLQPQFTAVPQQFTSFNPYQQQAQQEAMQAEYMRQQQEWQMQQQLQAQQLQQQQQQEEWMRQQQLLQLQQQQQQQQFLMPQQQPLMPQATGFGSNNPFAPSLAVSTSMQQHSSSPGPQTSSPVSFNLQGTYGNGPTSVSPPPLSHSAPPSAQRQNTMPMVKTRADDEHSKLANLLAAREDGIDTFGNWGNLRYGQQAGRLAGQPTGAPHNSHNPFTLQQQQQQQQGIANEQPFFSI